MEKKRIFWVCLLAALLACGIVFVGCPTEDHPPVEEPPTPIEGDVQEPDIFAHPASRDYAVGDSTISPLVIAAGVKEKGDSLSYQWYSNTEFSNIGGSIIAGAAGRNYRPSIPLDEPGEYFFFAEITNTNTRKTGEQSVTVRTHPARIRVLAAAAPVNHIFDISSAKYNYVRGVGGTGTPIGGPHATPEYIDVMMGPGGTGVNVLRIWLIYNYLTNSAVVNDDYFNVVRKVNEYGGYVFACPWTPPRDMKSNNAVGGRSNREGGPWVQGTEEFFNAYLLPEHYINYANWLRDYCQFMLDNDAPIYCVGIQNEPDWAHYYDGCKWSPQQHRDWFKQVGHFTTQIVTNEQEVLAGTAQPVFELSPIPGYGGGKRQPHIYVMSADPMGDPRFFDQTMDDPAANRNVDFFGRHFYATQDRYNKLVGTRDTPWEDKPDQGFVSAAGNGQGWRGQREIWQTEYAADLESDYIADEERPIVHTWGFVFDMMNQIDHSFRVNDESVYDYWYSYSWHGFVGEGEWGSAKNAITTRGRAVAHYARYVKHTYRLGISRTGGSEASLVYNTVSPSTGGAEAFLGPIKTNMDFKITPFIDENGEFINVVMFTPIPRWGGTAGDGLGTIQLNLPEDFIAQSAFAMKSSAPSSGSTDIQYWQDEPVMLSADGTSATLTMTGASIITVTFRK